MGDAIPSDESGINFNFAAGVGFVSSVSKTEYNDDGSYVEAVIATYEGNDFKLCRNCLGQYGVRRFVCDGIQCREDKRFRHSREGV